MCINVSRLCVYIYIPVVGILSASINCGFVGHLINVYFMSDFLKHDAIVTLTQLADNYCSICADLAIKVIDFFHSNLFTQESS